MQLVDKIKSVIFKVKDYDRIEHDYSAVLDFATGGVLSKTNYTLDSVYKAIRIEFINSAEFYRLSDNNKQVLRNQKKVMEEYLNILNLRTYENVDSFTITDLMIEPLKYERC